MEISTVIGFLHRITCIERSTKHLKEEIEDSIYDIKRDIKNIKETLECHNDNLKTLNEYNQLLEAYIDFYDIIPKENENYHWYSDIINKNKSAIASIISDTNDNVSLKDLVYKVHSMIKDSAEKSHSDKMYIALYNINNKDEPNDKYYLKMDNSFNNKKIARLIAILKDEGFYVEGRYSWGYYNSIYINWEKEKSK